MKPSSPSNRSHRTPWFLAVVLAIIGAILWLNRSQPLPAKTTPTPGQSAVVPVQPKHNDKQRNDRPEDDRAAWVEFDGQSRELLPNIRGEFPRISVPASTVITAQVPFAGASSGETVHVEAEDGGSLLGEAEGGTTRVDEQAAASIAFRTAAYDGLQRITLRRGGESRLLQFWIGEEPPVLARQ